LAYDALSQTVSISQASAASNGYLSSTDWSTFNSKLSSVAVAQTKFVTKDGSDLTGDGSLSKPYASIVAAMNSITDASPTKRYVISVAAGAYSETALQLKPNVFVVGPSRDSVRITNNTTIVLHSTFTGSGDNRSGFSQCAVLSACDFNWSTVTSAAGKIYCYEVSFSSTMNLYGHNNAIAQAQFDSCVIFGNMTVSGINVGVYTNNVNYGNITMTQHPNGGMATIINAAGGFCQGSVSLSATVSDFNRRCSLFARNFWMGAITINGASTYADVTDSSLPAAGATVTNGGNLVRINPSSSGANTSLSNLAFPTAVNQPILPATTNATNFGDWGMTSCLREYESLGSITKFAANGEKRFAKIPDIPPHSHCPAVLRCFSGDMFLQIRAAKASSAPIIAATKAPIPVELKITITIITAVCPIAADTALAF
jgi:hypothetical protein